MAGSYKSLTGKGLRVGSRIPVKLLKTGVSKKGKWYNFYYTDQVYNKYKKRYYNVTQYIIFVTNASKVDLREDDFVKIKYIDGFRASINTSEDGKEYRPLTVFASVERVDSLEEPKVDFSLAKMNSEIQIDDLDFGADTSFDDISIDDINFD